MLIGIKEAGSQQFDDSSELITFQPYKIDRVKVFYSTEGLLGIQLDYWSYKCQKIIKCSDHKINKVFGLSTMKLKLDIDENITHVSGHYDQTAIHRIEIKTSKDKSLHAGFPVGQAFHFIVPEGYQLTSISGGINKKLTYLEWAIQKLELEQDLEKKKYKWQCYQLFLKWQDQQQKESLISQLFSSYLKFLNNLLESTDLIQVCEPRAISNKSIYVLQQTFDELLKLSKYIQFKVESSPEQFVWRRYKDFAQLRELVTLKWPGFYVPPLPPKTFVKDFEQEFIEARRSQLEYFLVKLSRIPFFHDSVEYSIFIGRGSKNPITVEQAFTKLKEMTQHPTLQQLKLRFTQTFSSLEGPATLEQQSKINTFLAFLSKVQVEQLQVNNLAKYHMQQMKSLYQLSKSVLPDFESLVIEEKQQLPQDIQTMQLNFGRKAPKQQSADLDQQQQLTIIEGSTDTFQMLSDYFISEQREVLSYLNGVNYIKQIEKQKNKIETKLSSVGGILTQKLSEQETNALKSELEDYKVIQQILVKSYAEYYIDNFMKERRQLYYFTINSIAEDQLRNLKLVENFWKEMKNNLSLR